MAGNGSEEEQLSVRLGDALGASRSASRQRFGIYLPNKDRFGQVIDTIDDWTRRAMMLLSQINGGATAFPPTEGMWLDETDEPLSEQTVFVYSYIKDAGSFIESLHLLRAYLHMFGRDTNQGEVLVEFDDLSFWINSYDKPVAA